MKSLKQTFKSQLLTPVLVLSTLGAAISSALASPALALVPDIECSSQKEIAKVKKKKSRLKTFVTEYWRAAESRIKGYPADLQTKGFVVGDPHLENVDVYYNSKSKSEPMVFSFNDIDEAGFNYLAGDLLKLLSYLQSLNKKDLKAKEFIESYIAGLNNQAKAMPKELEALLRMTPEDYRKQERRYISKQRIKGAELAMTKRSSDEQETLDALRNMQVIKSLADVEAWTDQNSTGSSAGMTRYLYFGRNQTIAADGSVKPIGVEGIIEYKELTCTATGNPVSQNLESDIDAFVEYDARFLGLPIEQTLLGKQAVVYANKQHFLVRMKIPGLYKDLKIEGASPALLQTHGEYLAWFLGKFHRGKATAGYTQAVRANADFLISESVILTSAVAKQ